MRLGPEDSCWPGPEMPTTTPTTTPKSKPEPPAQQTKQTDRQ